MCIDCMFKEASGGTTHISEFTGGIEMKRLMSVILGVLVALSLVAFTATDDDYFPKKAWRKHVSQKGLEYTIYLPKKFKPTDIDLSYAEAYMRTASPANIISVGNLGYEGSMSKSDLYNLADDLYWDFYLSTDYNYYSIYEPSPIVNIFGHHGYEFELVEFDNDNQMYYSLFQFFVDGDGYVYSLLTMSTADHSPNVGQAVTFCMDNGCSRGLLKPLAANLKEASPAELISRLMPMRARALSELKKALHR